MTNNHPIYGYAEHWPVDPHSPELQTTAMSNNNQQSQTPLVYPDLPELPSRKDVPKEIMNMAKQDGATWANAHNSAEHYECAAMAYGFGILDMFEGFRKGMYDQYLRANSSQTVSQLKEGEKAVLDWNFNNASVVTVLAIRPNFSTVTDGKSQWETMTNRLSPIAFSSNSHPPKGDANTHESPSPTVEPAVDTEIYQLLCDALHRLSRNGRVRGYLAGDHEFVVKTSQYLKSLPSPPSIQQEASPSNGMKEEEKPATLASERITEMKEFIETDPTMGQLVEKALSMGLGLVFEFADFKEKSKDFIDLELSPNAQYLEGQKPDGPWKLEAHSYQLADTGDYDGHYELTDGKISIFTKDDTEDGFLEKVVDALNETGCKFYLDDSTEFIAYHERQRADDLQFQLSAANADRETADKFNGSLIDQLKRELKAAQTNSTIDPLALLKYVIESRYILISPENLLKEFIDNNSGQKDDISR